MSTDAKTGIKPISEWGNECARGFVSDSRFDPRGKVIKRANRETTRKWYRSGKRQDAAPKESQSA